MEKIILYVNGMSCAHCEKAITNGLLDLGVASVRASAKDNQVEVAFDTHVTLAAIQDEIVEMGYTLA
jgi:copper chaperone